MSDDLVERLHVKHAEHPNGYCRGCLNPWPCDGQRAADEIERLRAVSIGERSALREEFYRQVAAENRALRERLEKAADLKALIDEGFLVRSIEGDAEQGWALKILPKLQRLAEALRALDGEKLTNEHR